MSHRITLICDPLSAFANCRLHMHTRQGLEINVNSVYGM